MSIITFDTWGHHRAGATILSTALPTWVYLFMVTGSAGREDRVSLWVLADVLGDAAWLRFGLVGALLLSPVTLFVPISADVVAATGP